MGRNPDIIVDGVVSHPENDVNASCRFRRMSFRGVDGVGAGHADIVQVSGYGAEPDPSLSVLTECRYQIVGECGVFRVVVTEYQVPDLPAEPISGG